MTDVLVVIKLDSHTEFVEGQEHKMTDLMMCDVCTYVVYAFVGGVLTSYSLSDNLITNKVKSNHSQHLTNIATSIDIYIFIIVETKN